MWPWPTRNKHPSSEFTPCNTAQIRRARPRNPLLILGEEITRESGAKVTDVQGRSQGTITALMTVAIYDRSTAPQVERTEPELIPGERQALEAWLDFHRNKLLHRAPG